MLQLIGYMNEKIGRPVNKAMLMKKVGTTKVVVNKYNPDTGQQILKYGTEITGYDAQHNPQYAQVPDTEVKEFPQYRITRATYFSTSEYTWKVGKKTYLLNVQNTSYQRGSVNVQFIDDETGDGRNLSGFMVVPENFNPDKLSVWLEVRHLVAVAQQNKAEIAWTFIIIGLVMGVFVGFVLGQNAEGLLNGLNQVTAQSPTPTPIYIP